MTPLFRGRKATFIVLTFIIFWRVSVRVRGKVRVSGRVSKRVSGRVNAERRLSAEQCRVWSRARQSKVRNTSQVSRFAQLSLSVQSSNIHSPFPTAPTAAVARHSFLLISMVA